MSDIANWYRSEPDEIYFVLQLLKVCLQKLIYLLTVDFLSFDYKSRTTGWWTTCWRMTGWWTTLASDFCEG